MRSRKRPSKIRVLIIPQQGIASAMVHELAMLFCHAGADVFFAISEPAGKWFSPELAKAITGNDVFSETLRPAWLKSRHGFELAVTFAAPEDLHEEFSRLIEKASCLEILSSENALPKHRFQQKTLVRHHQIPADVAQLTSFYQALFASQMRLLAGRKFLEGAAASESAKRQNNDSESSDNRKRLAQALIDAGFSEKPGKNRMNLALIDACEPLPTSSADDLQALIFPDAESFKDAELPAVGQILIFLEDDRIHLKTSTNSRIIPSIGGQCCFTRLAEILSAKFRELRLQTK